MAGGQAVNLISAFSEAAWQAVTGIERPFVTHCLDEDSPALVWHVPAPASGRLSVLIPTVDSDRSGYFTRLLENIATQDFSDYELIVIKGDPRQGRAINIGVALAKGEYLLTLDDDSSLPDAQTFSKLLAVMQTSHDIGMAGGNNTIPEWASPFVKKVMAQIPRRSWEPVTEITDSDLAEHPCLIMRADVFRQVGGENELIPRGLDPYLRQEFRKAGYRVCLVPGVIYHHLPPDTWKRLMCQFYRNGYQAACVNQHYPQWVIETPPEHGSVIMHVPLWHRILRYPLRMLASLLAGKWIWFGCQTCYALGFLAGWLNARSRGDERVQA